MSTDQLAQMIRFLSVLEGQGFPPGKHSLEMRIQDIGEEEAIVVGYPV